MEPDEIFERQRTEFRRMRGSPHNVVFLDVDGVLNTLAAKERSPMGYIGIQKSKVQILHTILAQNDAVLVLSTSWKRSWSRSVPELSMNEDARYMAEQFADADVFACDKTNDDGFDRGRGIAEWLHTHPHKGWVVLDDETFPDYRDYGIFAHLIRTSIAPNGGLKEKHIRIAAALFAKQQEEKLGTEPKVPVPAK